MTRTLLTTFLSVLMLATAGLPAQVQAHPHARFSYQLNPVHKDGHIVGLRVTWLLDPLTSLIARRGMDLNRNGLVDPDELDAFARQNDGLVAASRYFLTLRSDQEALGFSVRQGLKASFGDNRIQLDFEVALERPVAEPLSVRMFDETWFVALTATDPPVPQDHACRGIAATQTLETQGWGAQPVPVVRLSCPAV